MSLAMPQAQTNPAATSVWIGMRSAFASEIRQKKQAFRTSRSCRGLLRNQFVRIYLLFLCGGDFCLAEFVAEPLQASTSRQHAAHHVPLASHSVAECVQSSLRIDLDLIAVSKHNSAGTHRCRHDAFANDAVADGAGGLVAAATDDRCPDLQTHCLCRDR